MTTQKPRNPPAPDHVELDEATLNAVTGGTDAAPKPQPTQSNTLKKFGDTSGGIVANIK
jgi:hypothetical protein